MIEADLSTTGSNRWCRPVSSALDQRPPPECRRLSAPSNALAVAPRLEIDVELDGNRDYTRRVRCHRTLLCLLFLFGLSVSSDAAPCKIIKVLPQLLDDQGRHTISPSLYGRDAYQAFLRSNPEKCSGMRFAIQWKARVKDSGGLLLRVEARVSKNATPLVLEQPVQRTGLFDRWTNLPLTGERYRAAGDVTAWRVTLWDGQSLLAEQKSFLW